MSSFFFFNDTATTEIYTLSLHDALPISCRPDNVSERSFSLRVDHGDEDFHRVQCGVGEHPCSTAQIDWRVRMPFGSGDLHEQREPRGRPAGRSEEHTSELQSQSNLVCRLLLEKKKKKHHTAAQS